jgi:hypothetical protein
MSDSKIEYEFSIIRGGLLDRLLSLLRISKTDKDSTLRKIIFFILITWVPLFVLAAIEGLLWTDALDLPFIREFATHTRLLIAIPLLVIAESVVDEKVKISIGQFSRSGLIKEESKAKFELAKQKADRMSESYIAEAAILLVIVANMLLRISANSIGLTTWAFPESDDLNALSLAGYWAAFISFPIFQFLILRWIWRWIIWHRLLNLISKSDLRLIPTHPDKSGGLGFLGESPLPFSIFAFVLSIIFSSMLAERMLFLNFNLNEHYPLLIVFILICVLINVVPLLSFIKPLSKARIKGINDYHSLIAQHHLNLEVKWIKNQKDKGDEILGNPDFSSAADIVSVYQAVENMTFFPFNIKTMLATVVISLLPLLFALAIQMPLVEILKTLAGFLL